MVISTIPCSGLPDGCLIGFVVIVCCTIQHVTTYKIAIIPRRLLLVACVVVAGCNAAVVSVRVCVLLVGSCGYATKKPLRCGCVAATD